LVEHDLFRKPVPTFRDHRTARTCAQIVIIPRNNTSDANAAGSFNTDLTMTSLAGT